jgi:geranylgeranyl diphosphate synthase, type II
VTTTPPGQRDAHRDSEFFEDMLSQYSATTNTALWEAIPDGGPPYLYDLVSVYPSRSSKGLRPALCLAACAALGGNHNRALQSAVAIELLHNGFLIHDDVQDESLARRGGATLHSEHGVGIAVNVGNATNLLALLRLMEDRQLLGPEISWRVFEQTALMMRHSLEGQAIEIGWIRDNVCNLTARDYLHMCLKKTSWYSFIYPLTVGAIMARGALHTHAQFHRFGWYVGAAFQIQDDILNLTGDFETYGKEIGGDLWEGKRTLMLIQLMNTCTPDEGKDVKAFLAKSRSERTQADVRSVYDLMVKYGSVDFARRAARQLAGAALIEALALSREWPDSTHKRFILGTPLYVVTRDR